MSVGAADRRSQRMEALRLANEARMERSRVLGGHSTRGKLSPERMAGLFLDPPEAVWRTSALHVLRRTRYYDWTRATKLLRSVGVSEHRLVGMLTARERRAIADALRLAVVRCRAARRGVATGRGWE